MKLSVVRVGERDAKTDVVVLYENCESSEHSLER